MRESFLGRGISKSLLAAVGRIAIGDSLNGIHWEVLNWNQKAIELYPAQGAEFCDQWRPVVLYGATLPRLAEKAL